NRALNAAEDVFSEGFVAEAPPETAAIRPIFGTHDVLLSCTFVFFLKDHGFPFSTTLADFSPVESYHPGKASTNAAKSSRRYARRPFILNARICSRSVIFFSVSSHTPRYLAAAFGPKRR